MRHLRYFLLKHKEITMRNALNVALLLAVAISSSPIGAFAHDGDGDDHHPVTNQQYPAGTYPATPSIYGGQQPGYLGQSGIGHVNDPRYNPGHNNSLRHQVKDAINSPGQGAAPGYAGVPQLAPAYAGYPAAAYPGGQGVYVGQPGAGHVNDPNYNPGHNNSLGHQLKDAVNPGSVPAYTAPGAVPGYGSGYPGVAPVGANHVNNPYINPGHNGSVQHQVNDAVNGNQVFPGQQVPMTNRKQHGHSQGHNDSDGHNH